MNKITYRPDIDGLRAVAILAVLVNHAFPKLLPGGFCGVDVFSLFVGDSFRGQYLPRLAKVLSDKTGSSRGGILLFHAAAPPIPGIANPQKVQVGTKLTEDTIELLEEQHRIDRIAKHFFKISSPEAKKSICSWINLGILDWHLKDF